MKRHVITLTYFEYMNLYQILHSINSLLEKKRYVLQGTKNIPSDLVAVSMLHNRYLFMYDATKTFEKHGNRRDFQFETYQVAALKNILDDTVDWSIALEDFKGRISKVIKPYEYESVQTEFQAYFEEHWKDMYEMTYTELRDEFVSLYHYLMNEFLTIKDESNNP